MEWSFERIASIIEAYIQVLTFFPQLENIKLEKIEHSKNSIGMIISNTTGILKLRMPNDYSEPYESEIRKTSFSIKIHRYDEITKHEDE